MKNLITDGSNISSKILLQLGHQAGHRRMPGRNPGGMLRQSRGNLSS